MEDEKLEKLNSQKVCLVIDWDPTALHLRYQTTQEFEHIEHWSLPDTVERLSESVALNSCLESYTKEEELSEEEKYMCAKCGTLQLATKKLQIWRLPPVLVRIYYKQLYFIYFIGNFIRLILLCYQLSLVNYLFTDCSL